MTSTTPGPGRPKDPAKRHAILAAAQAMFLRHGYEGSSVEAIAREAGVSKLTVYSHFTDKETLFLEAVKAKCEEQLPELFATRGAPDAIDVQLLGIGRAFLRLMDSPESVAMHRLMIGLGHSNPALVQLFYDAGPGRILGELERILRQANQRAQLQIAQPRTAAEHFCALLKGGHNFRLLIGLDTPQGTEDAERHVQEVVGLFMRAYARANDCLPSATGG